jgi:hypothetical protein
VPAAARSAARPSSDCHSSGVGRVRNGRDNNSAWPPTGMRVSRSAQSSFDSSETIRAVACRHSRPRNDEPEPSARNSPANSVVFPHFQWLVNSVELRRAR